MVSFIVSEPGNPALILTRDLLFEYWKNHNYLIHYFLIVIFFKMAVERYPQEWERIPFFSDMIAHELSGAVQSGEDYSEERMKEFAEKSDFHKLSYKVITPQIMQPSMILPHLINLYK